MTQIQQGQNAPGFTTTDQNGKRHDLKSYRGRHVVLAFIPGNNGQQDERELKAFNEVYGQLRDAGAEVLVVSRTDEQTQKNLAKGSGAKFPILRDKDGNISNNYGCAKNDLSLRNTFVIGPQGDVEKVYESVFPNNHGKEVLNQMHQLTGRPEKEAREVATNPS